MTQHVWDGMHLVLERNASGGVINRYERGMNGHLVRSTQHGFYLFNARGDVMHLTDASGAVIRTYRYDAFGNELNQNPNDTNPFRYASEYYDSETGSIYLRMRYFSPRLGRFTSPDPYWSVWNMQADSFAIRESANLYVYTMNNPIMFIDPLGLMSFILYDPNSQKRSSQGGLFGFGIDSHVKNMAKELSSLYNTEVTRVSTVGWTAETFAYWWDSLDGQHIDAIVFFGHGNWDRLQFDSKADQGRHSPNQALGLTMSQLSNLNLNVYSMDMLVLMSCNSGNVIRANNIATEFARNIQGVVYAPNGKLWVNSPILGGNVRVSESGNFIAHTYSSTGLTHLRAIDASRWRRPGTYLRQLHEWGANR